MQSVEGVAVLSYQGIAEAGPGAVGGGEVAPQEVRVEGPKRRLGRCVFVCLCMRMR